MPIIRSHESVRMNPRPSTAVSERVYGRSSALFGMIRRHRICLVVDSQATAKAHEARDEPTPRRTCSSTSRRCARLSYARRNGLAPRGAHENGRAMVALRDLLCPSDTSRTRSLTRSQPRSLLSMPRLNNARSRTRHCICRRTLAWRTKSADPRGRNDVPSASIERHGNGYRPQWLTRRAIGVSKPWNRRLLVHT